MHVLALKPDGTVLAWGEDWDEGGTNVSEWTDMAAVSADLRKSVGLTRDGTLVETLGKEWEIMLAVGDAASYTPKGTDLAVVHALSGPSVALDQPHAIGVRKDGTYFGPTEFYDSLFDSDERIEALLEAQSWTGLADVQSSYHMVVGLKTDGTLLVAGSNEHGQHDARSWTDIQAIALGSDFVAGLKNDGTVLFAGNDRNGMLDVSGWTDIVAIAADEHLIGLKANGTVVATGSKSDVMLVDGWHKIVAIAVNREHTFGLTADGKVLTSKGRYDDDPLEAWEGIVPDPARLVLP
jgi:alpha-tubulin suppressor-like RCC1 family protein